MSDVDIIKSRINIVDLISERVTLKRSSKNYVGLCPFHNEKTPSFSVSEEIQRYKCFGCGESGDILNFIMKIENMSFVEALEFLADKINYKLSNSYNKDKNSEYEKKKNTVSQINRESANCFVKNLFHSENLGNKYAKKRGLSQETMKSYMIGFASESADSLTKYFLNQGFSEKDLLDSSISVEKKSRIVDKFRSRLIFPIFTDRGEVVGFSGRDILPAQKDFTRPKYLNSSETIIFHKNKLIFGLFQAKEEIRKLKFVIICEGQMNILSSFQSGVGNVVASLGTSFSTDHIKLLSRYTNNFYFAFDKDTAGKKALVRALEICFKSGINVKVINWNADLGKDPDEIILKDKKHWIDAVNDPIDPVDYFIAEYEKKYSNIETNPNALSNFILFLHKLLENINDEVKREAYYKILAQKFDLSVEAIESNMQKNNKTKSIFDKNDKVEKSTQDTSISIFSKLFAMLLQNWPTSESLVMSVDRDYIPENYLEILDTITSLPSLDLETVRSEINENLQKIFDECLLLDLKLDENISFEEHFLKIQTQAKKEYKKYLISQIRANPDNENLLKKINSVSKIK